MDHDLYLKIPKIEVPVEIHFAGNGMVLEKFVFFLNSVTRTGKPETLDQLLQKGKMFLPARQTSGKTMCLNIDAISYLTGPGEEEMPVRKSVRMELADGKQLTVGHFRPMPAEHDRIQDYLNQSEYFAVFALGEKICLINKKKIVRVIES